MKIKNSESYSADKRLNENNQNKLKDTTNETNLDIYGLKKPVKAYDSPEFFKKVDFSFHFLFNKNLFLRLRHIILLTVILKIIQSQNSLK